VHEMVEATRHLTGSSEKCGYFTDENLVGTSN
jgi:hypothetical protein